MIAGDFVDRLQQVLLQLDDQLASFGFATEGEVEARGREVLLALRERLVAAIEHFTSALSAELDGADMARFEDRSFAVADDGLESTDKILLAGPGEPAAPRGEEADSGLVGFDGASERTPISDEAPLATAGDDEAALAAVGDDEAAADGEVDTVPPSEPGDETAVRGGPEDEVEAAGEEAGAEADAVGADSAGTEAATEGPDGEAALDAVEPNGPLHDPAATVGDGPTGKRSSP